MELTARSHPTDASENHVIMAVSVEILVLDSSARVLKVSWLGLKMWKVAEITSEFFTDYVGVGCQYELDACRAGMCKNGADCEDYENGYKCTCAPGTYM